MKPPPTRLIRRGLLAVVLVVGAAVVWNLLRPSGPPSERTATSPPAAEGTSIGDLSFFRFHGGEQKVQVKARTMSGEEGGAMHLEGVELRFPFTARGEDSGATVTADVCLYDASRESARFQGNVHVVTDDGVELATERLDYEGAEGLVASDEPVQFRRGRASGSARGLVYRSEADELELKSDVRLRFEDPGDGPPTEIQAHWARASRPTRTAEFRGDVFVEQGARELRSNRLEVKLDPELETIVRASAMGSVDLRLAGETALPGDVRGGGGERRLQCGRLDLDFRGPGVLEQAVAGRGPTLELLPGPADPPEMRRITAYVLRFLFDEQGRLREVGGGGGGGRARPEERMAVLTAEPLGGRPGTSKRVECARFTAHLVPETGELEGAELQEAVTFTEPGRQAWSQKAVYDERAGRLTLTGGAPRIRDEAEGSELEAETIVLGTTGGELTADGGVRHTLSRRTTEGEGGLFVGSEPTVLLSRHFGYDQGTKTARYRDGALLRSGRDEIRAPLIVLEEPAPGARRLRASGGVSSLLHPRPEKGESREPAPVATRSREMLYDEQADRVVYTGDVEIRQGDILTLSPEAVVTLTASGNAVLKMVAGEPVEVRQGARRATGRTGTYTPATETLVLVGDEVVLQDENRRVTGRVLTFQVGDDRIRIDGREETRTEAVFRKREAPQP